MHRAFQSIDPLDDMIIQKQLAQRTDLERFARAGIAPPADFVRPSFRARNDVETAVAIEIGDLHRVGHGPVSFDRVLIPVLAGVARVLEPRNLAVFSPRGGHHVDVFIAIDIGRACFE